MAWNRDQPEPEAAEPAARVAYAAIGCIISEPKEPRVTDLFRNFSAPKKVVTIELQRTGILTGCLPPSMPSVPVTLT